MEIKIGKRKYTLDKVSIYISDLYVEYVVASNDLITVDGDIEKIRLECEEAREESGNKLDKIRADLKMIRALLELKKDKKQAGLDGTKMRNKILEEIVILNGYEYDEMEWLKNFSESQWSDLIDDLIGGKKKDPESST